MSGLTIEQQFELVKLRQTIENASVEQLRDLFVEFYGVMLKKDNITKELLAKQWGMDGKSVNPSTLIDGLTVGNETRVVAVGDY